MKKNSEYIFEKPNGDAMNHNTMTVVALLTLCAILGSYLAVFVSATPSGASILSNSTSGAPTRTPSSRNDSRGTITTIVLSSIQQDDFWKAYVGNISGRLTLDNAGGYTIYEWPTSVTKEGEVFISRSSSVQWSNVSCANNSNIVSEHGYMGMTTAQTDNINKTFNATNNHITFAVGSTVGLTTITNNTCRSIATYLGGTNASQTMDGTQMYQEILLQDNTNGRLVYTTLLNSTSGFDSNSYDFQAIVPDASFYNGTGTVYYFYTELS